MTARGSWPTDDDFVPISFDADDLSDEALHEFARRAQELGDRFESQHRLGPMMLVRGAGNYAALVLMRREQGMMKDDAAGFNTFSEPTSPSDHRADDAGVVMAWAISVIDDSSTSAGARTAWLRLLRTLAAELRRRRAEV